MTIKVKVGGEEREWDDVFAPIQLPIWSRATPTHDVFVYDHIATSDGKEWPAHIQVETSIDDDGDYMLLADDARELSDAIQEAIHFMERLAR